MPSTKIASTGHEPFSDRYYNSILENVLKNRFILKIVDEFWSYFNEAEHEKYGLHSPQPLIEAVISLQKSLDRINQHISHKRGKEEFTSQLKSRIFSTRPYYLDKYVEATYFRALKTFIRLEYEESSDIEEDSGQYWSNSPSINLEACSDCNSSHNNHECKTMYNNFWRMNHILRDLDLLKGLVGDTIMVVSRAFIERRVLTLGKSNYSSSYLNDLTGWVNDTVTRWVLNIYELQKKSTESETLIDELNKFLKNAYANNRVSHMFEIIIEYPNSEAAIQDLRVCLEQSTSSSFRLNLIESVKQSLIESLLHPGVNTYDILTAYISAIKALRSLDPSGLILQLVTEPVRRYLKSRSDTVRCIVTALTDEDHSSELNKEMIEGSQTIENGIEGKGSSIVMNIPSEGERCTATNFERWKPDPIKLNSIDEQIKTSRFSDIVSILVNIYETKDSFVVEYQKLLSQRLLSKYSECNLDAELRNLELLTLRFSDCELHRCEVMLKDVQTSKRVNKRIVSGDIRDHQLNKFKNLDVLIISSPFWPEKFGPTATLYDEAPNISFPKDIQSAINTYTKAFEAIQASRTLHWRHHLGTINMDVTINGRTQNFNVTPLHASLLFMFKTKKTWRIHEIIQETSLTAAAIRSRLSLWQRNGLIRDCGDDKFELITE